MYEFNYHRPSSVVDARKILESCDEPSLIAGGMTLLPTLKLRLAQATDLVDLRGIDALREIIIDVQQVQIGAMVTHGQVAASEDIRAVIPALADLAGMIGDPQVRNCGTIGGSIANSDPAADYPAAVLGLGARVHTNQRTIAADDYFLGMFETALNAHEIVERVSFPKPRRAAYAKFPNPASRYAVVGVFIAKTDSGVRVAVTGAGGCAFRVAAMEEALGRDFSASALDGITVDAAELNDDLHASAAYRAHLVGVMAKRALAAVGG